MSVRVLAAATVLLIGAAAAMPTPAGATVETITVNSNVDPGNADCTTGGCTLREAMAQANDSDLSDVDQINIDLDNPLFPPITLASPLDIIDEPLAITSVGDDPARISGNNMFRVFTINTLTGADVSLNGLVVRDGFSTEDGGGISTIGADLTLSGVTVTNNGTTGGFDEGGGIYSDNPGTLTIQQSLVTGNSTAGDASAGGGVRSNNAPLTITGSTISQNQTNGNTAVGGGVTATGAATKLIANSTITGNHTDGDGQGGGLALIGGTVENSTISGNFTTASGAHGGGIINAGDLTVRGSTVSGNHTGLASGGGIAGVNAGTLTIDRSTVSGNYTMGGSQHGGGVFSDTNTALRVLSSTIADNRTLGLGATGGGIYTQGTSPEPLIQNSIVADNLQSAIVALVPQDIATLNDTFAVTHSLIESPDSTPITTTVPGSNIIAVDPQLGALLANGGPTLTHRPAALSPVVDKGSSNGPTDQRGFTRPVDLAHVLNGAGNGADMGAVELTTAEGPPAPTTKKKCKKKKKKKKRAASAKKKKKKKCKKKKKKKR